MFKYAMSTPSFSSALASNTMSRIAYVTSLLLSEAFTIMSRCCKNQYLYHAVRLAGSIALRDFSKAIQPPLFYSDQSFWIQAWFSSGRLDCGS